MKIKQLKLYVKKFFSFLKFDILKHIVNTPSCFKESSTVFSLKKKNGKFVNNI